MIPESPWLQTFNGLRKTKLNITVAHMVRAPLHFINFMLCKFHLTKNKK